LPHEIASGREPKVRVHEVKTPPPELLNPDAVAQLRETLTLSVRHDLLSTFESSVTASVRAMQSASRSGDVLALRRAAHNLAGGAATVGATALASRCRQIEHGAEQPLVAEEVLLLGPVVADTHSHLRTQLELL
jgi:HPt (histidine-containing phosphotransfer) domain-containing protein